jgi:RNA polymerase sigma-70 factor (ECF subfamily)
MDINLLNLFVFCELDLVARPLPFHRRGRSGQEVTMSRQNDPRVELSPELGERERAYVFAIAMQYVKEEDAAADIAQEALLCAHRHRDQFRGDSRFSTWLYRIAATTALMYLRKRRRLAREVLTAMRLGDDETRQLDIPDPGCNPENRVAAAELVTEVNRSLDRLGDKYREVFWLRFRDGYTESEIAERLGLNLTTVKTRAFRARKRIREALPVAA